MTREGFLRWGIFMAIAGAIMLVTLHSSMQDWQFITASIGLVYSGILIGRNSES